MFHCTAERVGPSLCSSSGSDGGEEEGFQKLGVNELLAPILLTFMSTTMGLIVFYYPRYVLTLTYMQ